MKRPEVTLTTAILKRTILTLAAAAVLAATTVSAGFGAAPKIGDKARPFALMGLDGTTVSLAGETARGPVVLVLARGWPGYQCPFCTRQFADFMAHAKEFEGLGASVVWVYPGPSDQVVQRAKEFVASQPLPASFRFVTDPDYTFTNAYGLRWNAPNETSYPSTFVIDRTSVVRFAHISNAHDGRARAADVVAALKALAPRAR
jgi:peroxiredoxin